MVSPKFSAYFASAKDLNLGVRNTKNQGDSLEITLVVVVEVQYLVLAGFPRFTMWAAAFQSDSDIRMI